MRWRTNIKEDVMNKDNLMTIGFFLVLAVNAGLLSLVLK